jgi:hypothetical protein
LCSRSSVIELRARANARKTWRRIDGPEKIKLLLAGIAFRDGEPIQDDQPVQQKLAPIRRAPFGRWPIFRLGFSFVSSGRP